MTDHDLPDLLDRLGERTLVGAPPTAAMLAAATRARRRRTTWLAVGSTAAALAVTISGAALLNSDPEQVLPEPAPGVPTPTQVVAPAGTRLVGLGHAAIAVPEEWGTNRLRCATPVHDTVIIDQGAVCLADYPRPEDVESVHVYRGWYGGFGQPNEVGTQSFDLDGERAERVATACYREYDGTGVCTGAVYLPDQEVSFVVDSSSENPRAKVAEILSWIHMISDQVGIPGFQHINFTWYHAEVTAADHYRAELEKLGLRVEVVAHERQVLEVGNVLSVEPQPGTMVAPGSVVTVTEVASPTSP